MLNKLFKLIGKIGLSFVGFFVVFDLFYIVLNWVIPTVHDLWLRPLLMLEVVIWGPLNFIFPDGFFIGLEYTVIILVTILSAVTFEKSKVEKNLWATIIFYLLIPPIVLLLLVRLNIIFF